MPETEPQYMLNYEQSYGTTSIRYTSQTEIGFTDCGALQISCPINVGITSLSTDKIHTDIYNLSFTEDQIRQAFVGNGVKVLRTKEYKIIYKGKQVKVHKIGVVCKMNLDDILAGFTPEVEEREYTIGTPGQLIFFDMRELESRK